MAKDGFRLPSSSYEEVTNIIKAYGRYQAGASLDDVSKAAAIQPDTITRNNAFLGEIDVVEGGRKKALTEKGRGLSHALRFEDSMPTEISERWRDITSDNEFFQNLISAINIRKGMELSNLRSHIAYSAGLAPNKRVMTGASTVIDILKVSEQVREEDGKIVATSSKGPGGEGPGGEGPGGEGPSEETKGQTPQNPSAEAKDVDASAPSSGVIVNLQIQIQCSADEVDELAPKIESLVERITKVKNFTEPKSDE